ncbi:bacterial transferase hexapeptide three repeat family protein [Asticcacaulis biprosthecium C19]|uniref:Bacterial transferase hexapeptide three repeat family protein n=1 Tax=Asticcacaulis biprosthecium C19 TaxID=715226 RepID=F4QRM5_9CAUL|nr:gamma carbonic anhydrase family protein [Asticcacaulis biprosthecium]EGF90151.1 bacterial transferase hexapeptide three repeat family protein [Asticcacaulis biprosthecium C19]
MTVYRLGDVAPVLPESGPLWIAPSAEIMGNVRLGEDTSIWFHSILRADNEPMIIGARSNIQDGSVLHSDPGSPLTVGEGVTVGHKVVLHGCTIGDNSLVGIGAIVLNRAVIGRDSLVGAGSLVPEGKVYPDGVLLLGSPARVVRELTPEQIAGLRRSADHYVENARRFLRDLAALP